MLVRGCFIAVPMEHTRYYPIRRFVILLAAQVRTKYGMEVLAQQDGSSVPANQFLTLTNSPTTGAVEGIPEPGGWYQNGGSWLLWEFLAEYSALRHGDWSALNGH